MVKILPKRFKQFQWLHYAIECELILLEGQWVYGIEITVVNEVDDEHCSTVQWKSDMLRLMIAGVYGWVRRPLWYQTDYMSMLLNLINSLRSDFYVF